MSFVHSKDFVTNLDDKCIQPNAVDLRLSTIEEFGGYPNPTFDVMWYRPKIVISEEASKEFGDRHQAVRHVMYGRDGYLLKPNRAYDVVTKHSVKIPEGMVGWCHIRSTLSRNGIILSGGLYDAGYDGVIGFTLHNLSPNEIHLDDNVRIAQFIMGAAETAHLYDGYYNQNEGLSK